MCVSVHTGYRFELGSRFYATPWLGVSYAFSVEDLTLGGETFSEGLQIQELPSVMKIRQSRNLSPQDGSPLTNA
jgi:hypothetical protein